MKSEPVEKFFCPRTSSFDKEEIMTEYINVEPTWESLCYLASENCLPAIELMPACAVADLVRQAQKKGAKSITFSFNPETREVEFEVLDYEEEQ